MKTIIQIFALILITQFALAQKKPVRYNQLFIKNEITGKSVKMNASSSTLKNFGTFVSIDSLDQNNYESDVVVQYTFTNIIFKVSSKGNITTFETKSDEISLEGKGEFSISPGDHIDKITAIFPEEVKEARIIKMGDEKPYLLVNLYLSSFNKDHNKFIEGDSEYIALQFNPDTKILEVIKNVIRP